MIALNSEESKSFLSPELDSRLSGYVRRSLRDLNLPHTAFDDIRQEVLLKLMPLSDERWEEIENVDGYLFTVVRNEARRFRERTTHSSEISVDQEESRIQLSDYASDARRIESGILLRDVWKKLSAEERQIFQLMIIGYNDKEMALRLGISHTNARKRVSRLRARIRGLMLESQDPGK